MYSIYLCIYIYLKYVCDAIKGRRTALQSECFNFQTVFAAAFQLSSSCSTLRSVFRSNDGGQLCVSVSPETTP